VLIGWTVSGTQFSSFSATWEEYFKKRLNENHGISEALQTILGRETDIKEML
jgi:hypothetical protein